MGGLGAAFCDLCADLADFVTRSTLITIVFEDWQIAAWGVVGTGDVEKVGRLFEIEGVETDATGGDGAAWVPLGDEVGGASGGVRVVGNLGCGDGGAMR